MKWSESSDTLCPVAQASAIVGDRWTLLILREAFLGARTFDAFQTRIGLSPHLLSSRLKRLVTEDVFSRADGVRSDYRLTAAGRALLPIILSLAKWGNDWRSQSDSHTMHVHTVCGQEMYPIMACSECGDSLGFDVETRLSRALTDERAERTMKHSRKKSKP